MTLNKYEHSPALSLLTMLNDQLLLRVRSEPRAFGYDVFSVDLSSWRLSFSNQTPVIRISRDDILNTSARNVVTSIQELIALSRWDVQTAVLILVEGDAAELRRVPNTDYNVVYIDLATMMQLLELKRPVTELRDAITSQLLLSTLVPYETTAPVVGNRFFGREVELRTMMATPETNYLVLGIRRIGKTSLLKEMQRRLIGDRTDEETRHMLYLDCSKIVDTRQFALEVISRINPRNAERIDNQANISFYLERFFEQMHKRFKTRPTLFLDEVDNMFLYQQNNGYDLLTTMRKIYNNGHCRYFFAGFKWAKKTIHSFYSPILEFAEEHELTSLSRKQAKEMVLTPFSNIGVKFENSDLILSRIYAETAGLPLLLQIYCRVLTGMLDSQESPEHIITLDMLTKVQEDNRLKNFLLESFKESTGPLEKAAVFAIIAVLDDDVRPFTMEEIDEALVRYGIPLTSLQLDAACDVLELSGVLRFEEKQYAFIAPMFPKLIKQNFNLDYRLKKLKQEI